MRTEKILSASAASSTVTCFNLRVSGSIVVFQSSSGIISPSPLNRCMVTLLEDEATSWFSSASLHKSPLVAEEEGEQQRPDVRAVHVGVRHEDDPMVAQLRGGELVALDAEPQARDQRLYLRVAVHLCVVRLLDVQDLPSQREHRLELAAPALLGRPARAVPLHYEDFRLRRVGARAVRQLARQHGGA
eukprot:CAMPEP_0182848650 /NCGR_PEP_ID=MMETSP0006_2-20121128/29115_1 /TAXON_ID=97485 /ORGANISM="Prymnesium parvum, Strain Texoma1" /LENGTH=187 /DNA_ID=CAMNT_0024979085 /DNA_START=276 /DNA_END=836 /DNA_ORIENTATION=-